MASRATTQDKLHISSIESAFQAENDGSRGGDEKTKSKSTRSSPALKLMEASLKRAGSIKDIANGSQSSTPASAPSSSAHNTGSSSNHMERSETLLQQAEAERKMKEVYDRRQNALQREEELKKKQNEEFSRSPTAQLVNALNVPAAASPRLGGANRISPLASPASGSTTSAASSSSSSTTKTSISLPQPSSARGTSADASSHSSTGGAVALSMSPSSASSASASTAPALSRSPRNAHLTSHPSAANVVTGSGSSAASVSPSSSASASASFASTSSTVSSVSPASVSSSSSLSDSLKRDKKEKKEKKEKKDGSMIRFAKTTDEPLPVRKESGESRIRRGSKSSKDLTANSSAATTPLSSSPLSQSTSAVKHSSSPQRIEDSPQRKDTNQLREQLYSGGAVSTKELKKKKEGRGSGILESPKASASIPDSPKARSGSGSGTHHSSHVDKEVLKSTLVRIQEREKELAEQETKLRHLCKFTCIFCQKVNEVDMNAILGKERVVSQSELLKRTSITPQLVNLTLKYDEKTILRCQKHVRRWLMRKRFMQLTKEFKNHSSSLYLRLRNETLKEIVETEKTYLGALEKLRKTVITPLEESARSVKKNQILSRQDIYDIFSNVELMVDFHSELLRELNERLAQWPSKTHFGDIFLKMAPIMKLYSMYIRNYDRAMERLQHAKKNNEKFLAFLASPEVGRVIGAQSIEAFLIMPVQRLPRYEMLLRTLIKYTAEEHVDYANLDEALKKVKAVIETINQRAREEQDKALILSLEQKLNEKVLTDDRTILFWSPLLLRKTPHDGKDASERVLYLFNDLLLLVREKKKTFSDQMEGEAKERANLFNEKILVHTNENPSSSSSSTNLVTNTNSSSNLSAVSASGSASNLNAASSSSSSTSAVDEGRKLCVDISLMHTGKRYTLELLDVGAKMKLIGALRQLENVQMLS